MSYKNLTSDNNKTYQNLNVSNLDLNDSDNYTADFNTGSFPVSTTYGNVRIDNFPDIPAASRLFYNIANPTITENSLIFVTFDTEGSIPKSSVICHLGLRSSGFFDVSLYNPTAGLIAMDGTALISYWILN